MIVSSKSKSSLPIIFCVEDEVDLREVLVEEIEDAGYRVIQAADGQEALEALAHTRPDLILCDIIMPRMDGYELLHHIRENHADLADVPFVFLTAQDGSGQIISGKHAGVDDYLVKPVDFDLMLATIQARLRQVQRFREKITNEQLAIIKNEFVLNIESTIFQRVSQTFDLISTAIVLLNHQAKALFMNSAARQLIAAEVCTPLSSMMLSKNNQSYFYHREIREAINASKNEEDHIGYLSLSRNDGKRDVLLTICALASSESSESSEDNPVVALFLCHTERNEPVPIKALEALFQLTPMESRVAWAFAQGMRTNEIAELFTISITTIAFHKRNIFQKTHTNRQADLVALLLTLPIALSI